MALFGNQMQPAKPMTDAEQLAQLMQGNLAGQLSGSDKLMALSALLRSVSRGRTQTPEQALQGFQQQKMQEVQGRIQIEQLRKAAERKAQLDALKAEYVSNAPNPQAARELQLMNEEDFSAFLRERNKPTQQSLDGIRAQLADLYGFGTPQYNQALKSYIERQQTFAGPGGAVYTQQPVTLPALPTGQQPVTESAALSQARDAISKGADPATVRARLRSLGINDAKL
jgi:hypothetical protein